MDGAVENKSIAAIGLQCPHFEGVCAERSHLSHRPVQLIRTSKPAKYRLYPTDVSMYLSSPSHWSPHLTLLLSVT